MASLYAHGVAAYYYVKPKIQDRKYRFLLNHAGLSIALWGAILGSGDLQRLHMVTQTGTLEWRSYR